MGFLYVLIILCATLIGAICGMGGGVIIKPLLDAVSDFSTFQIGVISGSCVLAMSTTSLFKHYLAKTKVNFKVALYLSIGSIAGGFLGDYLFGIIETASKTQFGAEAEAVIKTVQNSLLFVMIVMVLAYMLFIKKKNYHFHLKNPLMITVVGLFLGALSVFLDIGGGPINVCAFVFLFGMDVKEAGISSLITIFFAQITKFVKYGISEAFLKNVFFDASLTVPVLVLLVVCAVAGGLMGAIINKKFSEKFINTVYCSALGFVAVLAVFNIVSNALAL